MCSLFCDISAFCYTSTMTQKMKIKNTVVRFGAGTFLLLAVFGGGFYAGTYGASKADASAVVGILNPSAQPIEGVDLSEFWRVWRILDEKFVYASSTDVATKEERVQGAIAGLVASLGDDYTTYFPPVEAEAFNTEMSGEFGGVGMEVGLRDGVITVIAPLEGTPAFKAGIMAGDKITAIDGHSTKDMAVDAAVKIIRGEKGTPVKVTIFREGELETRDIEIIRDTISIPTVKTETRGDVFVIKLYTFNQIAEQKFVEALREYVSSGKTKLILDMRGNPGGYMDTAISLASYFVPVGEVVLRERIGNEGQETIHRSTGKTLGKFAPQKMVVLIDKGSASAAEILAGALSEHDVATLIGETSFGKGTVQELVDLPSSSSLKVTIARWFTPLNNSINKHGLVPDIEVKRTVEDIKAEKDPQMEEALKFLR